MRTFVLGLGNPILGDDAVGLRVARAIRARLPEREDFEVDEDTWGGLRLMERLIGFDRAVIIDAMQSGATPGSRRWLAPDGIPTRHTASTHDVTLPTALSLGRQAGARLPADADIHILAIEAANLDQFTEVLTPAVELAIPDAVDDILRLLKQEGTL